MKLLQALVANKLEEAKKIIFERLDTIAFKMLDEAKLYMSLDTYDNMDEGIQNIVKMGRITRIKRRVRRNSKGKIVIQRNRRKSGVKGYRISGNTVRRIPATVRLRKARLLKRSWKTTRRAKLRRSLLKRKMTMRRRQSIGLR